MRLIGVAGAIIAIELIAGLMEWLLMPASSCRNSLGSLALIVVGIGALIFGLTSAGTWWQGLIGRRILGAGQRRLEGLRETNPSRTSRIDAIGKLFGGTQLTESIWNHPWLTGLVGGGFGVIVFGGLFIVGAWIQPNTCGS
jgi:hypothetical protein